MESWPRLSQLHEQEDPCTLGGACFLVYHVIDRYSCYSANPA